MSCVTPADLGRPIAAIVERCGAPGMVMSLAGYHQMFYVDGGSSTSVFFDADQTRARVLEFFTSPAEPSQEPPVWNVTLPFESGARAIALGQTTLADAQNTLASDADVTTRGGAAFRSTLQNDVVLAASSENHIVLAAYVGERASLVQMDVIEPPIGQAPLDFMSPVPHERRLRFGEGSGARTTIFRIDVDAGGIARTVTIIVASGDAAFDATTQKRLGDATFRPAMLGKGRVSGTSFIQVRH